MNEVAGAGTCVRKTPPRYTLYPLTPEPLSVEPFHVRLISLQLIATAFSLLGVEGTVVSAGVVALAMFE